MTDFGVSSVTKNEFSETKLYTVRNNGASTLYMAPEQLNLICYEHLTDIYGFGSTMADIFFGIKIQYGIRLKEFLGIKVETEIEKGIKRILERCLKTEP